MLFQQNCVLISDLEKLYLSLYISHIFLLNHSKQNYFLALIFHHIKTVLETEEISYTGVFQYFCSKETTVRKK